MFFFNTEDLGLYHFCEEWTSEEAWCEFILKDDFYYCETCIFKFPIIFALGSPVNTTCKRFYQIGTDYHIHPSHKSLIKLEYK